jgi:hypothetical protein
VSDVDPRLVSALTEQLARRSGGRVGWKLGVGDGERIADEIAVGHLTAETLLEPGSVYRGGGGSLHADAEVAVAADLAGRPAEARRVPAAVGERLEPGDRVITGSVVQVPVEAGDEVVADFGPLGRAWLSIA